MIEIEKAVEIIEAVDTCEVGQDECKAAFISELETSQMDVFCLEHLEEHFCSFQGTYKYENNAHFSHMSVL